MTSTGSETGIGLPERIAPALAWAALALCAAGLLGSLLHIPALVTLGSSRPAMTPSTALGLGMAASSLLLLHQSLTGAPVWRWWGRALAIGGLAIGAITLVQYAFDLAPSYELWLLPPGQDLSQTPFPGRPSPQTAGLLVLISVSLLLAASPRRGAHRGAWIGGILVFYITWFLLAALISGNQAVYAVQGAPLTGISVPTALSALLVSAGLVALRTQRGLMALLTRPTASGEGLRWLIPAALLTPLLVGEAVDALMASWGLSLTTAASLDRAGEAVVLTAFGLWFAVRLDQHERRLVADLEERARLAAQAERAETLAQVAEERRLQAEALELLTQRLRISNKALERYAQAANHDMRAPLRAIDNVSQWLVEELDNGDERAARELLQTLMAQSRRMRDLLNNLLLSAQFGEMDHRREEVDVAAEAQAAFDVLDPPRGLNLIIEGDLPTLTTPRAPLAQVVRNLIDNAIKHSGAREGRITVTGIDRGEFLEVRVSDDGPGLPPHRDGTPRGFEPVEASQLDIRLGFGLMLIQKILSEIGGHLTAANRPGGGATFAFTWPRDAGIAQRSHKG